MGSWGPGVFSDDVGCDVRDHYRGLIRDGLEGPAATDALLESFQEVLSDEESEAPFWLALAVTQWRMGRLEDRVKARALAAIESGSALSSWQETAAPAKARQRELQKVWQLLQSPQRAKTKPRKQVERCASRDLKPIAANAQKGGGLFLTVQEVNEQIRAAFPDNRFSGMVTHG